MGQPRRRISLPLQVVLAASVAFAATYAAGATGTLSGIVAHLSDGAAQIQVAALAGTAGGGCRIKGNVSYAGGERIYHVPGQHYYEDTVIDPARGERWFCTEQEARAAGWRRAGY